MKIKICCISSIQEAKTAIASGADVLGLVGDMPSGPGIISDELAATIAAHVPDQIETFLLSSETSAAGVIAHHRKVKSTALQLVDELESGAYADIRTALPNVKLVQVIHVIDQDSVKQAELAAKHVDVLLLDSGNPNLAIKELGGTGRTHDWDLSQQIVEAVSIPVYLAGGLSAANVAQAVKQVRPYGLDLCSSVRTDDGLDAEKLTNFIEACQSA